MVVLSRDDYIHVYLKTFKDQGMTPDQARRRSKLWYNKLFREEYRKKTLNFLNKFELDKIADSLPKDLHNNIYKYLF